MPAEWTVDQRRRDVLQALAMRRTQRIQVRGTRLGDRSNPEADRLDMEIRDLESMLANLDEEEV